MQVYSVFVMDFVVVEAENEDDAAAQANEWFKELIANDEVSFDVVEGDESENGEDPDVSS
ncbi:MAG: hypothetical protein ACRDG3_08595 [Tepidiformaceae bacterium]